ncbi:alpha/beta hydrolase [Tsukamurella sp. 8F]|uniref:alpha/beta fold hydrolase n=1 Tax=unclassified Tsukamurella TaxID=2633480 RepID=UPI0023B8CFF9|nr:MULTISPECIES: alpha/beta hydrolase [unclassified Tsukamurella]MDF0529858.1 alpha/beta hydrolase [Tsukamurella sp. 8J]MDF0587050.1 alpha/beta hydrolase [Tsukamurella sp. 8F]
MTLAYERFGNGEPLVLVHGIAHRRQAWYPVAERLAEHREVILFDLPGHGESPALDLEGRPVKDVLQEQLVDLFDHLGLHRPHIAGNSLGGRVALEAAADGLASSATTLSPAGFWRGDADFALIRAHFAILVTSGLLASPVAPTLTRSALGRKLMMGTLMTHGERLDAERVAGDLANMVNSRHALHDIIGGAFPFDGAIPSDVPVTIAWGTRDLVLLPYQARRARKQLPQAEHIWLEGAGHVPMSDDVDSVVDILLRGSSHGLREARAA